MRQRQAAELTRSQILEVATDHFRRFGHHRTTVSDIASECRMSPANVYRFFDGKAALVEAVAEIWLQETVETQRRILSGRAKASERLKNFVVELCKLTFLRFRKERQMHDLCAMVAEQQWPVGQRHAERMIAILAAILKRGVETGEFELEDVDSSAATIWVATSRFHNPLLVPRSSEEFAIAAQQAVELVDLLQRGIARK